MFENRMINSVFGEKMAKSFTKSAETSILDQEKVKYLSVVKNARKVKFDKAFARMDKFMSSSNFGYELSSD
jgi:hypothetical protein